MLRSCDQIPNTDIPSFAERAEQSIGRAASTLRFSDTRHRRVLRRFSIREVSDFLGFDRAFVSNWLDHEDGPDGIPEGRERTLSVDDLMLIRALASTRSNARRKTLFWRKPEDVLPVICIAAQKGGTGKTSTAAHLAQYASLYYGLRVGVIDADPQSSLSLYFADDKTKIASIDADTFTVFMGVGEPNTPPLHHGPEELNAFWKSTPWPGLRMMPGGVPIQEADIAMHFLARGPDKSYRRVYRLLRDAIARWDAAHPPRTQPKDLIDGSGRFRRDVYEAALTETLDLVIIDTAPALTMPQLNCVVAADTLIIPQTMKGFDLSTLRIYLSSLAQYLRFIRLEDDPVRFNPSPSYVLPTIISLASDTDLRHVGELYRTDPEVVCPIYYARSEAVANAAEDYLSIYEYVPPKARRASAQAFMLNANAVSDAILSRALSHLPSRGFANQFIAQNHPEGMPAWTGAAA